MLYDGPKESSEERKVLLNHLSRSSTAILLFKTFNSSRKQAFIQMYFILIRKRVRSETKRSPNGCMRLNLYPIVEIIMKKSNEEILS